MYGIALKMLFGDRGKYIAMVVGVTFAALIMTQQPSIMVGLLSRAYSFIGDVGEPDIWVMDPGVKFVEENKPLRDVELNKVRGIPGVKWAVPMFKNLVRARLPDGNTETFDITGLDDATLVGAPSRLLDGTTLADLRKPDAILISKEAAETKARVHLPDGTTRPLAIGDVVEINDRRAVIAGYVKTTRNFVLQPHAFTTYTRALSYSPPDRKKMSYILVKAREGVDHDALVERIKETTKLDAFTAEDFKNKNLDYWAKSTGIVVNFGIAVTLGFLVGAAIVGQTFFTFVNQNAKHYAALKSMGVRNSVLARMVMLQAAVVGFTGYGIGVGLTALFGINFLDHILAFRMPVVLLAFTALGVFLIIGLTAWIAIRKVTRIDPAVVFRS